MPPPFAFSLKQQQLGMVLTTQSHFVQVVRTLILSQDWINLWLFATKKRIFIHSSS